MKTIFLTLVFLPFFASAEFKEFTFDNPPELGTTKAGQKISLGGISAMHVVSQDAQSIEIIGITDRGPNARKDKKRRPFVLPDYTPRLVRLRLEIANGRVLSKDEILLRDSAKKPFGGRPPYVPGTADRGEIEVPVDLNGHVLAVDPLGIDPEGLCAAPDGSFWVSDEYGPGLFHFSPGGVLLERLSPGAGLPEWVTRRPSNNGFEGLACDGDKLFAILQSPLEFKKSQNELSIRLLEIDPKSKNESDKTSAIYVYKLNGKKFKIGDLARSGPGKFLVIEQNGETGAEATRDVYEIELSGATDIMNAPGAKPELLTEDELGGQIKILKKTKVLDLAKEGFDVEKAEAVAELNDGRILIGSDNDFGLDGKADFKTGRVKMDPAKKSLFGLFTRAP